jgi:bifunctional NMN adenylyltransferase/nudix hydrolase
MKEKVNKPTDVGVIVGRFQVNELHEAHIDLITSVTNKHDRVLVFLGNSIIRNTTSNPLDYRARRAMIADKFPNVEIHYINDNPSDLAWSKNLDKLISEQLMPLQTVTLYGSRDSFLKGYSGKYNTCELEATTFISGTEVRRRVSNNYPATSDYRAGMIAATAYRYPTAFQCVDIAVVNDKQEVLLARKPDEKKWRFIGGFSDPRTSSLEEDAKREVQEEAGIEVEIISYLGSTLIDDWRYRGEQDKIKTALFLAKYIFGKPEGADDIAEVKWVPIGTGLAKDNIELLHHVLVDMFNEKFGNNRELQDKVFQPQIDGNMP